MAERMCNEEDIERATGHLGNVRTVPSMRTSGAMTLWRVPPEIEPNEHTTGCTGLTSHISGSPDREDALRRLRPRRQ